jgi:hypothetical protein
MSKTVNDIVTDIQKVQTPVGILMKHHYGYDSKSIYGCDRLLLDGMVEQKLTFEMKPVLIHFNGEGTLDDDRSDASVHSTVHWLTGEALDLVRTKLAEQENKSKNNDSESAKRQKKDDSPGIVFIDGEKYNQSGRPEEGLVYGTAAWKTPRRVWATKVVHTLNRASTSVTPSLWNLRS